MFLFYSFVEDGSQIPAWVPPAEGIGDHISYSYAYGVCLYRLRPIHTHSLAAWLRPISLTTIVCVIVMIITAITTIVIISVIITIIIIIIIIIG